MGNPRATAKLVGIVDIAFSSSLFLVAVLITTLPSWVHHHQPPSPSNKGSSTTNLEIAHQQRHVEYYYFIPTTDTTPSERDPPRPSIVDSLLDSSRLQQTSTWVLLIGAPAFLTFILVLASIVLIQASNPKRPPDEALEMLRHWNWCSIFGLLLCGLYAWTAIVCLGPRFPPWPVPCLLLLIRGVFIYLVRRFQREVVYCIPSIKNLSSLREPTPIEHTMSAQEREAKLDALKKLPWEEHDAKLRQLPREFRSDPRIFMSTRGGLMVRPSYLASAERESNERIRRDFPFRSSSSGGRKGSCDGALLQCVAPCAGFSGGSSRGGGKAGKRGRRMSDAY